MSLVYLNIGSLFLPHSNPCITVYVQKRYTIKEAYRAGPVMLAFNNTELQTHRGNLDFFGPQKALAYRLDAISQGPKKSRFPGPKSLPLALVMDAARIKSIMHGAV